MADHPCKGMTKAQRQAFEQVACGDGLPSAMPKTLAKLVERGLIQRATDKVLGRDQLGVIAIPQYFVPLAIHMQWCEWCSENCDELP